jgi:Methyltransferase domain
MEPSVEDLPNECPVPEESSTLNDFFRAMELKGWSRGNARFYLNYLFDGIDLRGKAMLDVGAGDGRFSFYAACAGASHVVSLEPEGLGSSDAVTREFQGLQQLLPVQVELVREPLEEFQPRRHAFDVLFLHASVNHLNEDACMRLHADPAARAVYRELFAKLAGAASRGAKVIVVDAARRNLFADLGLKNPLVPDIDWEKHQSPKLWIKLLGDVGFAHPKIRWNSFNPLRSPGRLTIGNRLASYCLNSMFCITMEKAEERADCSKSSPS